MILRFSVVSGNLRVRASPFYDSKLVGMFRRGPGGPERQSGKARVELEKLERAEEIGRAA